MQPTLKRFVCRVSGAVVALAAGLIICSPAAPTAFASDAMSTGEQNALVQKYCAVCHTDAARNGGLSLQHFDAANADPSLTAMMLSKLTSGVALEIVKAAASGSTAAALVSRKMKRGAMGAAGIPIPDQATIDALIRALAFESAGANEWNVNRTEDPATQAPKLTASIAREAPSATNYGEASMYRLVLACNLATHQGDVQLSWAPVPNTGTLSAVVDGKTRFAYQVEGTEKMGDGTQGTAKAAAMSLHESSEGSQITKMPLPAQTLSISNLFPDEMVEFPFGDLAQTVRQSLAACFTESNSAQ